MLKLAVCKSFSVSKLHTRSSDAKEQLPCVLSMFAMHATSDMANAIVMVAMVQAVLDVDAESCNERIRCGESSCV